MTDLSTSTPEPTVDLDDVLVQRAILVIDRNAQDDVEFHTFVSMLTGWELGAYERQERQSA
jgi:hypothetical protein